MVKRFYVFLFVSALFASLGYAQEVPEEQDTRSRYFEILSRRFSEEFNIEKSRAVEYAGKMKIPVKKELDDGRIIELQYINRLGIPVYHTTHNAEAAVTVSTDKLHPGGVSGLDLSGTGYAIGIWDAGVVDSSHLEFRGRLVLKDSIEDPDGHATHVAGTLAAEGVNASARGMSFGADILSYDWNNYISELTVEGAAGMLVSNHSYGIKLGWTRDNGKWVWNGDPDARSDYRFGYYSQRESRNLDYVASIAPNLLMVWSAGNYRTGVGDGTREPNGPWNCMGPEGVAKNVLAVGAIEKIPGGYSEPSDVVMTSFSSWGPPDDGRVKPDLVAPGRNIFSTDLNNHYRVSSGTSMAAPVVAGSMLLLQELYGSLTGDTLRSATLKALAIHTAYETGFNRGPDYRFGWGMLNTAAAAGLIVNTGNEGVFVEELTLEENDTIQIIINADGTSDITATIVWTDPPGTPVHPDSLDIENLMLVNDLDLRIATRAGDAWLPWVLDPAKPDQPAGRGDNFRDNVEKILIDNPEPREYIVSITHKGELKDGSQDFSLVITASVIEDEHVPVLYWVGDGGNWNDPFNWALSSGGSPVEDIPGPGVNVVFDENSFSEGLQSVIIDQDVYCRSFSWMVKGSNGIDFTGGNIISYGDFLVSQGIYSSEGNGFFVLRGERGLINTGDNDGVPYNLLFDNENAEWRLLSDIIIDNLILYGGNVDMSGKRVEINNLLYEGELPVYLDLSGTDIYPAGIVDMRGENFRFDLSGSSIIIDIPEGGDNVVLRGESPGFNSIEVKSGGLDLEGDMDAGRILNRSLLKFLGNNTIGELILESGSETLLLGGSEQVLSNLVIYSEPEEMAYIGSLSDVPATLFVSDYLKFCFDSIHIFNVRAEGGAVFVAGENSILSGDTSGWVERPCEEVIFARFEVDYPCVDAYTRFADLSDGNIKNWLWEFGDQHNPLDTSTLRNPNYTYPNPGIYTVTLNIDDSTDSAGLSREIEIIENTIPENEIFINIFGVFVSTKTAPSYQWYNNDTPIPGAVNRTLPAGDYTGEIRVLLSDDVCNRFSNTLVVSVDDPVEDEAGFTVYPNPAGDNIFVEIIHPHTGIVILEVIDPSGRVIHFSREQKQDLRLFRVLDSSQFYPGIYYIRLTAGEDVFVKRVAKTY